MKYKVEYTAQAVKQLKKLDKHTAALIYGWIDKNLVDCENPRLHGKGLTANRSGQWRYRIGDYRLIAEIQDEKITILLLNIGHRKEIYD
ncbi:MAG: type II toxin-antitoxin system RelE/ParE family toxin [Ruminococcus sp.]|nr:type II toxin-antitoxin system RelE/ParE family toxin [Ruminococcus sp.]